MQAEVSVEIEYRLARNVDAGTHGVVPRIGVRDYDVQSVGGAALKDHDQALVAQGAFDGAESGAREEARHRGRADDGESAVAKKNATGDGHGEPQFSVLSDGLICER